MRLITTLIVVAIALAALNIYVTISSDIDRAGFSEMCKTMGGVPVLGLDNSNVCLKEDAIRAQ